MLDRRKGLECESALSSLQPATVTEEEVVKEEQKIRHNMQHSQGDEESMVQHLGFEYRPITGEARAAAFFAIGLELCKIAM